MAEASVVYECANGPCKKEFRRMGEGKLYAFQIDDPNAWGLPPHMKQKAVWLCRECASSHYVRLDRKRHAVQLVRRPHAHNMAA